jgi:hypothetical protein
MKSNENNKGVPDVDPAEAAWELFEKTGNLSYYLLYKKLR